MVGKTGTSSGCSTRPCVQQWCAFQRLNNMLEFFRQYLSAIDYYHACFIHIETVIDIERFDLHTSNESTERFYVSCQRIEQIVFNVICFCSIWDNRNWSQCDTGYGVYLRWRWRSRSDAGTSLPPKLSTLKAKVNFNSDSGRFTDVHINLFVWPETCNWSDLV